MARVIDHTAAFTDALRAKLATNLDDAAEFLVGEIKGKIGIQGPPRSTPGNPPHMDTTALHESIAHSPADPDELVARIGSDVAYAVVLETEMSRPYWVVSLLENADEIAARVLKP